MDNSVTTFEIRDHHVFGTITDADMRGIEAEVIVWHQRIRSRHQLGVGFTNAEGQYDIPYLAPETQPGNLIIVVEARSRRLESPLVSDPLTATPEMQVDLSVVAHDRSEFGSLLHTIRPQLDNLTLLDVAETPEHRDISFLSQETGRNKEQITQLVIAARLESAYSIPSAAFYAFLRQRTPSTLPNPLLDATQDFAVVDALVSRIAQMIFGLSAETQNQTLTTAVKQKIIAKRFQDEIPEWVRRMQRQRTADRLTQPYLLGKTTLGQLLDTAGLAREKHADFARALTTNILSMRNFWRTLGDGDHGFTADEAGRIERTLSIGAFIKNHPPLLDLILQRFQQGTYKALSDLARLSVQDWIALVNQSGAPPSIDAAGEAEPAEVFARVVYTRVTRAYPTIALASRVTSGKILPEGDQRTLSTFFLNNSDLDLSRNNLTVYVEEKQKKNEDAFAGIQQRDRPALVANARRLQRVLFISSQVDTAETLLKLDIHSATQITMMGRQMFFNSATGAGLTKREANRVYETAQNRYAGLVNLYTQFHRDAIGIWPTAIGDPAALNAVVAEAVQRDQSLATLFGSQDYCATDSCTSILSPAAYVCDLLHWLKQRMTGAQSALDIFNLRRPDIPNLKLNCPNTDIPLPYIDLVNELLADAISPPLDPNSTINPIWKQTSDSKTAADLRAAPEYFNQPAYVVLFNANYPHWLPYSDGLNQLRTVLLKSSVPLWQLRQALLPIHTPTVNQRAAVAAERFSMSLHDVQLTTTANFIPAATAWNTANPTTDLVPLQPSGGAPGFLRPSGLTYEQLLEILQVQWVKGAIDLKILGIDDTCDTSIQSLGPSPLDADLLDRMHRFLRLWRRSGYKMWELDLLLRSPAVGNGTLDVNALPALFAFRKLQDSGNLVVDQLLAFYQNMDVSTHRDPDASTTIPLFARVFLNPAVVSQHPDPDLKAISTGGIVVDSVLGNHLDAIQAGLGISATDATALVTTFGMAGAGTLTLANLSQLYRVSLLAATAHASIADLQTLATLLNPGAANTAAAINALFANVAATQTFLDQVKAASASGFTTDQLVYLLTPPPWTTVSGLTDSGIATVMAAVRQAILNPNGPVEGSVTASLGVQLGLANDVTAFLVQQFNVPGTAQTVIAVLTDASIVAQPGGNFLDLTRANFPNQFAAVQLLDKFGLLVKRLHLVLADLSWIVTNSAVYSGLNFASLPVTGAQPAIGVSPLLNTALMVKLARLFTAAPPASPIQTLYDLIGGVNAGTIATDNAAQVALATITGWTLADILALTTAIGMTLAAGDYKIPANFDALRNLEAMIAAMGGKAQGAQLVSWAQTPADEITAEAMASSALNVLKAQYSNDEWLSVAPKLMDPIREDRSNALQSYLVAHGDSAGHKFADVDALFDWNMIDVQMSSCEVTTRIVQAYIAIQIFVERCRMNLEAPSVAIDPKDDAWEWWRYLKRFRLWDAAREVFLFPENWLIESQRPSRTEIFAKLEQEVHQGEHTIDQLETVALHYIDRLEEIAHLHVTGTCKDPLTNTIHVVARTHADPPRFYHRSLSDGIWTGWISIPIDIKAHQVVPAVFRGRLCLFWPQIKVAAEPRQILPNAQIQNSPPPQEISKFVSMSLYFSVFRNGTWAPHQAARGKLFDVPFLSSSTISDNRSIEALYTLKVNPVPPSPGFGATLNIDVFRLHDYTVFNIDFLLFQSTFEMDLNPTSAVHIGRAVFDGRFSDLELRNLHVYVNGEDVLLLDHAQQIYGPDSRTLLPLHAPDPDLVADSQLVPEAGALSTVPPNSSSTLQLNFTPVVLQQNPGPLLNAARVPFRVVGPATDLVFDPSSYFFYQDNRRSYFVSTVKYFWTGSAWAPVPPSNPDSAPFEARYLFQRFYHPYTKLIWHQLGGGGFPALYDQNLQLNPDQVDPSHSDVFNFQNTYQPVTPTVSWGENNEILDFSASAAYSVYNWELFFHTPFYIAQLLSQNQQFEDALKWYHYIFDPTRQSADPAPKRFWITKPLYNLTSSEILSGRINNLLQLVNAGDANAVSQVAAWRKDPFNPFLLADLRPVAYMKAVVMSYLDNLIAWADNLFATDSREALSEATLLYVIAAEILGPQPVAIEPPKHADESYNELAPKLDAFANALVDIENAMGSGGGGGGGGGGMPPPQTFYFKIPPNDKLLGYWKTVADRLYKLRHCQNIQGVTRQLALFDAPIDPGLLIKARAAGIDIGSVLSDVTAPLSNYRFTALYTQALDFVNAVRAYGTSLLGALEKSDSAALAVLQQTIQQQLVSDTDQIFQWQIDKAQHDLDAIEKTIELQDSKYSFNHSQDYMNAAEIVDVVLGSTFIAINVGAAIAELIAAGLHSIPQFALGVSGFGGTPAATAAEGGTNFGNAGNAAAQAGKTTATILDKSGTLSRNQGSYQHRKDNWEQAAREADIAKKQAEIQRDGAAISLAIAQLNLENHTNQSEYIQKQLDFLTDKFTNQELYDWQVGQLADTYFQSYRLAYQLCKQVERCYRFELGIDDSSFIQFGYWDSLHKGLLAGEILNHDLRRLQAAYLENNVRRHEISRFVSLAALNPVAFAQLLISGACDFDLPESMFDHDYPGHYHRHLFRVSVTVSYPAPGKFDNVKGTLTMVSNKVRASTDTAPGYAENPLGADTRFRYNYAAVPQSIVLGNAQDDPGLFLTTLSNNLSDQRYLPFEGSGAVSSWHFEMPAASNEIQLNKVTDVVLHLYYTALDGGDGLKAAAMGA